MFYNHQNTMSCVVYSVAIGKVLPANILPIFGEESEGFLQKIVVVKYVGDTFLDLSYEKQPGHPDKKGSPVPPEG